MAPGHCGVLDHAVHEPVLVQNLGRLHAVVLVEILVGPPVYLVGDHALEHHEAVLAEFEHIGVVQRRLAVVLPHSLPSLSRMNSKPSPNVRESSSIRASSGNFITRQPLRTASRTV